MKFVLEAMGLTDSGGKRIGVNLLSKLPAHTRHEFVLLIPDLPEYAQIHGPNIKAIRRPVPKSLLARYRFLSRTVAAVCRDEHADAFVGLGNFVPRKPNCPAVVYSQNAFLVCPEPLGGTRLILRERLIHAYGRYHYRHLPAAICIVVQTEAMKRHMCAVLGIEPSRVTVIPPGPLVESEVRKGGAPNLAPEASRAFTFLCLSRYYVHKNIEILPTAMLRLPLYTKKAAQCLITISADQHPRAAALLKTLSSGGTDNRVINIGPVCPDRIGDVYRSADAYILPTLLETYSLTYDEAWHFGLPIATSDRDFARSRLGNAAIYFDPLDADSVARAMARVMEDADLRQSLVENGRRILAKAPTWDEIAAQFVNVLERAACGELPIRTESADEPANQSCSAELQFSTCRPPDQVGTGSGRGYMRPKPLGLDCAEQSSATLGAQSFALRNPNRLAADDVRALFNREARSWHGKYGPRGKLDSRVEQFTGRLAELCPPPGNILDLGCGTGEIAAALEQRGYHVTACDLAEEMIAVARANHHRTSVEWVCLEPDWEVLPFADRRFDGIVASSVFEYLVDVPRVAAELARVLRPEGVLLLSVPNPCNGVRKLEGWLQSMPFIPQLASVLRRVPRIDSYAAYLRLSRNRFEGPGWQSMLSAVDFAPLDKKDFAREAWREQANAPLVLLAVKRAARGWGEVDAARQRQNVSFEAAVTNCPI